MKINHHRVGLVALTIALAQAGAARAAEAVDALPLYISPVGTLMARLFGWMFG